MNRQAFIDSLLTDIHNLNSDMEFYAKELADREILQREYRLQHLYKGWAVMSLDKAAWKLRIKQAKRLKKKLLGVYRKASQWL